MKLLTVTFYKLKMMISDKLFLGAMILIPLLITIAAGYALRYEKFNTIPVAFVDEDGSSCSKTLLERLSAKEGLEVLTAGREKAAGMLRNNEVEVLFVIREGFGEKIARGECKELIDMVRSPASFSADFIAEVTTGEVMRFVTNHFAAGWVKGQYEKLGKPAGEDLEKEVIRYADSQWEPGPLMTVRYMELDGGGVKEVSRASIPAAAATSAGIIIVFIMFYLLFSSSWLIEERINGTLKRLLAGPGALGISFAGSSLALFIAGAFQVALFSLVDRLAFGVNLFPGVLSYLIFMAYTLAVISVSMLLSSVLKTPAQLQAGAPVFALFTGFAGGCFWNFVEMPERLRQLALITPQGWVLKGLNALLLNPADLSSAAMPILVLFSITLILLPLSYIIISKNTIN